MAFQLSPQARDLIVEASRAVTKELAGFAMDSLTQANKAPPARVPIRREARPIPDFRPIRYASSTGCPWCDVAKHLVVARMWLTRASRTDPRFVPFYREQAVSALDQALALVDVTPMLVPVLRSPIVGLQQAMIFGREPLEIVASLDSLIDTSLSNAERPAASPTYEPPINAHGGPTNGPSIRADYDPAINQFAAGNPDPNGRSN